LRAQAGLQKTGFASCSQADLYFVVRSKNITKKAR